MHLLKSTVSRGALEAAQVDFRKANSNMWKCLAKFLLKEGNVYLYVCVYINIDICIYVVHQLYPNRGPPCFSTEKGKETLAGNAMLCFLGGQSVAPVKS